MLNCVLIYLLHLSWIICNLSVFSISQLTLECTLEYVLTTNTLCPFSCFFILLGLTVFFLWTKLFEFFIKILCGKKFLQVRFKKIRDDYWQINHVIYFTISYLTIGPHKPKWVGGLVQWLNREVAMLNTAATIFRFKRVLSIPIAEGFSLLSWPVSLRFKIWKRNDTPGWRTALLATQLTAHSCLVC